MAPFIRIFLRYAAGYLVARGLLLPADANGIVGDPDVIIAVETLVGLAIAGANELWYWLARRFDWAK